MARKGKAAAPARKSASGRVIRARVSAYDAVDSALALGVNRGILRHDKYSIAPLRGDLRLLENEIVSSFWLTLDDAGVELK